MAFATYVGMILLLIVACRLLLADPIVPPVSSAFAFVMFAELLAETTAMYTYLAIALWQGGRR